MESRLKVIPECDLGFFEFNETQSITILFIHGALGSPTETSLVTPHLQNYHILIPALHINKKNIAPKPPFTMDYMCSQLAVLVQQKAKNGHTHVFGFSMDASIALNLAMKHPNLLSTLIASGVGSASRFSWWKRAGFSSVIYAQSILPRRTLSKQKQIQLFNRTIRPASKTLAIDIADEPFEGDWELCQQICDSMRKSLPPGKPVNVRARSLIIAGTATIGDSVDDVRYVVNAIRESGGFAEGAEIKQGGHPWLLQLPELCADVIKSWIEENDLPHGASKVDVSIKS